MAASGHLQLNHSSALAGRVSKTALWGISVPEGLLCFKGPGLILAPARAPEAPCSPCVRQLLIDGRKTCKDASCRSDGG